MDLGLTGNVAVVTGGGRNVGAEIARALAGEGARVAVSDLDGDTAESTAAGIRESGGDARGYGLDISDGAAVEHVVAQVEADFGPVDVLVNNAARLPGFTTFAQQTALPPAERDWNALVDVNVHGLMCMISAVAGGMAERGAGSIVSIASAKQRAEGSRGAPNQNEKPRTMTRPGLSYVLGLRTGRPGG